MIICMLVAAMAATMSAGTVNYTADNSTIFANPERGFITMLSGHLSTSDPYVVKGEESTLEAKKSSEKMSIVLVHYYLDNYRTTATLPSKVLNGFDEDMQVLRDKGMKAIIRFSYANSTTGSGKNETAQDAAWSIVKQHIQQYRSHWQANADVIFCFQAGIVGAWGEWYYSANYGNQTSHINDARRKVIDTLLSAVPHDRCIQLRTPQFKTEYLGNESPLTAAEAYQNTPKARLGHHNDAFLYGPDNMGTYQDTATQKPYIAQETLYVPIGGETDITDDAQAITDASYDKTTAEMSRLHWTFIQSGYSETVTDKWRANGTFDELNRKMGYRLQLVSGTYSNEVEQGGQLAVNLQIKNTGYAPLYNRRPAYIVLSNQNSVISIPLAADPRTWLPNGVVSTVEETLTLPSDIPAGDYDLYLYLPDAYASLADDPRYAVRFANTGVWDSETGMNALGATVSVTERETPPTPPTPSGDGILLPATLNKANVTAYSEDMTWYNTYYFDFGPEDAENLDRWAEWKVELRYPGKYIVSEVMKSVMAEWGLVGHSWQLSLLPETGTAVSTYTTEGKWEEGELSYEAKWDLSGITPNTYTLRVMNVIKWAQPKLKSLTLQYDGNIPTDEQALEAADSQQDNSKHDLLGREVDEHYRGIVITRGRKWLQL